MDLELTKDRSMKRGTVTFWFRADDKFTVEVVAYTASSAMFADYSRPRQGPRFTSGALDGEDSDQTETSSRSPSHNPGLQSGHQSRSRTSGDAESSEVAPVPSLGTSVDQAPMAPHWSAKRHLTCGNPTPPPPWSSKTPPWRYSSPGKLKTASASLVLCLNLDVEPPDVVKTQPCATLECWVDPASMPVPRAVEAIGQNLQHQFEGLSLKIQYKVVLDPSLEDLRRSCQQQRKLAKDDAALFHYNGHGVPKPTAGGELWCFNRTYTQYLPVSLNEVQTWLGSPGVYIWDCSAAGNLLENFNIFAERRDAETNLQLGGYTNGQQPFMQSLQLAACAANETLPTCPELPADLFTSCLTSPIDIALRFFIMEHQLPNNLSIGDVHHLPGDLKDRRTPLGELNWIFTAITDTIAWTTFSKDTFSRLYRCDLLIASLFRNFLLAERIMKNYNCTPHTHPPLPPTNTHPLWATWDLAVDTCLRGIATAKAGGDVKPQAPPPSQPSPLSSTLIRPPPVFAPGRLGQLTAKSVAEKSPAVPHAPNQFFAEQLTAFEVWISRGGSALTRRGPMSLPPSEKGSSSPEFFSAYDRARDHHLVPRKPPDQLPIVLQVLLSQPHRLRALILLSQFVDLGPWAVNLVLSIGIFPYISKLLQAPGQDLRPVLIFIWARILAVDPSVQADLYTNQQGYKYFSNILSMKKDSLLPNWSEHQAMCSFILAAMSRDYPRGRQACWDENVFRNCSDRLDDPDFLLRQWTALCIGQMWDSYDEGKRVAYCDYGTTDKLTQLLSDDSVEVRCAALFALGTFMGASGSSDPHKQGGGGTGAMHDYDDRTHFRMEVAVVTGATLAIKDDASPMCRKELLVVISCLVKEWRGYFVVCAWIYWEEDRKWRSGSPGSNNPHMFEEDVTGRAIREWLNEFGGHDQLLLLDLSVDPYHEVAANAQTIVDYIMALLLASPFKQLQPASFRHVPHVIPTDDPPLEASRSHRNSMHSSPTIPPPSPVNARPNMPRSDTVASISNSVSSTLRRTSSFVKSFGIIFPSYDDGRPSAAPPFTNYFRSDFGDISRPPSPNLNFAHYESPYSRPPTPQTRNSFSDQQPVEELRFSPFQVMDALMEEDMQRLIARKRVSRRPHTNGASPSPSGSTFSVDSMGSFNVGIGTGVGIRDVLPLKSTFFDWCCEYFTEPQMRQTEVDEPGSIQYNYQVWRQQRNDEVDLLSRMQLETAADNTWDRSVVTMHGIANPLTLAFHGYDKHLVVANETDVISVWDWSRRRRLNHFSNGNSKDTVITALEIINQDVGGIIVAGSSDGLVRLYRNYDPTMEQGPLQMVSAFRGLHEVIQLRQGAGLVMNWDQAPGTLLVGGDCRVIKAWDAGTENAGLDLDTNSDSPVTAISSTGWSHHLFAASFADGEIKLFDRRMDDDEPITLTYSEHTSWVQNIRPHPTNKYQLLSASLDGDVKLWDIRAAGSVQTWSLDSSGISAFDVHPQAQVFAGTSSLTPTNYRGQRITIRSLKNLTSSPLSDWSIPTGIAGVPRALPSPYIPRYSSLAFHPIELLYGVGLPDGTLRVLGCRPRDIPVSFDLSR